MYMVLGIEVFNYAEVLGIHNNKKIALNHAEILNKNKNKNCCQNYKVLTNTEVKKKKIVLY